MKNTVIIQIKMNSLFSRNKQIYNTVLTDISTFSRSDFFFLYEQIQVRLKNYLNLYFQRNRQKYNPGITDFSTSSRLKNSLYKDTGKFKINFNSLFSKKQVEK